MGIPTSTLVEYINIFGTTPELKQGLMTWAQLESSMGQNNRAYVENDAGALGPYQFTRDTAADYGLPLDARNDPFASTAAAARYLEENLPKFGGNIEHTLQSVFSGVTGTKTAIAKAEATGKPYQRYLGPNSREHNQKLVSALGTGTYGIWDSADFVEPDAAFYPKSDQILKDGYAQNPSTLFQNSGGNAGGINMAQSNSVQEYNKGIGLQQGAMVGQAISDFGTQWNKSILDKSRGKMALRSGKEAASVIGRQVRGAQGTAAAKTASSGVDVSSVTSRDIVRTIGIYGGQDQAAVMADASRAKIAAETEAKLGRVNAFMSLIGGAMDAYTMGMNKIPTLSSAANIQSGAGRAGWHSRA